MLPTNDVVNHFTGTGSLAVYPFDFKIKSEDELLVIVTDASGNETERVRGSDTSYLDSITFDAIEGGGEVTLLVDLPSDYEIYLLLAPDEPVQDNSFRNQFDFSLKRIEAAFDQFVAYVQRLAYLAKYSLRLHDLDSYDDFDPMLPQGVSSNVDDRLPVVSSGGFAPVSTWPLVSDLAVSNVTNVTGSRADPTEVSTNIPFAGAYWQNTWYIQGDGSAVNLSTNPQIAPGSVVGQRLRLVGCSDANSVTLEDATGLDLNGTCVLVDKSVIDLEWDGVSWFETSRR
jgi:hypothetical protein